MALAKPVKTRRRGATLEHAIINVAWKKLHEHGYTNLTMEMIATAANTSRSVLARRWESKPMLVLAALQHQLAKHPRHVPDMGDVRSELLEYLNRLSVFAPIFSTVNALLENEAFRKKFASPAELRMALRAGQPDNLDLIYERAAIRGEIDPNKINPAIQTLLRDLLRHHVMMHRCAPPESLRIAWVDTVFLPLVRPAGKPTRA